MYARPCICVWADRQWSWPDQHEPEGGTAQAHIGDGSWSWLAVWKQGLRRFAFQASGLFHELDLVESLLTRPFGRGRNRYEQPRRYCAITTSDGPVIGPAFTGLTLNTPNQTSMHMHSYSIMYMVHSYAGVGANTFKHGTMHDHMRVHSYTINMMTSSFKNIKFNNCQDWVISHARYTCESINDVDVGSTSV